jgi:hypothetical protein
MARRQKNVAWSAKRRTCCVALLVGALGASVGCSGGNTHATAPPSDAGVDAAGPEPGDAGTNGMEGAAFSDLYRDLFARAGAAKCQSPSCHGADPPAGGPYMGTDRAGVYQALTTYQYLGKVLVVPGSDAPMSAALLEVVDPDTGFMPRLDGALANRRLTHEELARIELWLSRGAPFD